MSSLLDQAINSLNNGLAPITPQGVNGVQFLSVFLITYSIIFIVLRRVNLFDKNKPAILMLSIIAAFFTASSTFSVILITKLFPSLGMVTAMLISFIAVIGLVPTGKKKITFAPLMVISGLILIIYFTWIGVSGSISINGLTMPKLTKDEYYSLVFGGVFLTFILLIYFSGDKKKDSKVGDKAIKALKFLLGVED